MSANQIYIVNQVYDVIGILTRITMFFVMPVNILLECCHKCECW